MTGIKRTLPVIAPAKLILSLCWKLAMPEGKRVNVVTDDLNHILLLHLLRFIVHHRGGDSSDSTSLSAFARISARSYRAVKRIRLDNLCMGT